MPGPVARAPVAVIRSGSARRELAPGEQLAFGRGQGNDLRIGHDPADLRIPRYAGRLECRPDGVLIHNTSDKRSLVVETFPGEPFEVLPLMVGGTGPHDLVTVTIDGEHGVYSVSVDVTGLRAARRPPRAPLPMTAVIGAASGATVGFARIESLTPRHRMLLCALCLPSAFGWNGQHGTPSYAEMEQILAERGHRTSAKTIRNVLDDLRRELATAHGVDGVWEEPGAERAGRESYLPRLARWARLSGNVTTEELSDFEALAG
ncbi:hypothetical protein SAMN06264364_108125 [Quadrisphaera granulorum]|uniref:FHA domain-containing protein n=1 Tax=Quadrisphaera granulorum TaxID=317664 RepID=A0A316AAJ9_9ACTN|nr:hypothetical protein [Quadrisphaera granulorum]PWJ54218.1 hypothetical protein BXY45_108125 [Quadrisphaera granulorum]SZE96357.1 hypothetical protein SAMN06264364_108125 [Quadrisphaera granulorum]